MRALVTGGTSGIGKEIALELSRRGYDLLLVSRNENDFKKMVKEARTHLEFLSYDLSKEEECRRLLLETEKTEIDVFVSNAGFGDIGAFDRTFLEKEIEMVKVNDIATLILVKGFMIRFSERNRGKILVTASAAAFGVAGYMNVYYASKAFVYSLMHGYYRELKDRKSKVRVSVLCPGPVKTAFEKRGNMEFSLHAQDPKKIARYAVSCFFRGRFEIVPCLSMKLSHVFSHLVPKRWISKLLNKQAQIKNGN